MDEKYMAAEEVLKKYGQEHLRIGARHMEELKNALAELYLKHGNHEIIVDLSQILDRYIVEKQIDKVNKN